jgi:hypothetical protein
MRIRADGLTPSAPRFGLLSVAHVLEGDGRWLNGVTLDPAPCGCVDDGFDPACDDTPPTIMGDEYPEGEAPSLDFDPFMVAKIRRCSVMGLGPFDEFVADLQAAFDAGQGAAVEHEFATSTLVNTNPGLESEGSTILDESALGMTDAFAALEGAIADSCRAGVIHATPAAATWAARLNLIARDGQVLRTMLGTPVAVGAGYTGDGPGGDPAPEGGAWLYATGPIRVRLGDVHRYPEDLSGISRSINRLIVRVERPALVEWDRCLHAAQLAALGEQTSDLGSGS